ncbi:helix-turn-helix domain-containing protein [Millisia brevis]|uniref:helix-turn-helix domain-containing protein n=1 Tax=Millisia brevis TaxID=264148 RepID=UPI000A027DE1|nr:helix-turn-helix domain-containing protein [Millisia brevis]
MSTVENRQNSSIVFDRREQEQARKLLSTIGSDPTSITVGDADHVASPVPSELAELLREVIHSVASGTRLTLASLPEELTTTVAADQLGISRPTLMKMINSGEIPAHKVGSHHRVRTSDVMTFKKQRLQRQIDALTELRELETALDEF